MAIITNGNDLKLLKDCPRCAPEDFRAWANLDAIVAGRYGKIITPCHSAVETQGAQLLCLSAHTYACRVCLKMVKNSQSRAARQSER